MDDVVVIGAGHAGLAASWHLARRGVGHMVLERGRVGETWRTQRWDSFALNTPTGMSRLPGVETDPGPDDGFLVRDAWIAHLDGYATRFALPVRTGADVTGLSRAPDGTFEIQLADAGETLRARSVIVAAGAQRNPRIPALAGSLPAGVLQLPTSGYRNPAATPPGAILVVGAAQSGGQVVEDLLDAGRTVHLATSRVPRVRRRMRGRDSFEWLARSGFFDQAVTALTDPDLQFAPQPIVSGVGRHGHTISLQWLEARGVRLLGRLRSIDGGRLTFHDDLGANIRFGDEQSAQATRQIAAGLARAGLDADLPPLEDDPADVRHADPEGVHAPTSLDLDAAGIATVIWATGYAPNFDWLPPAWLDDRGGLRHRDGAAPVPGLFALGFPWLRTRGSGIVYGTDRDAAAVVEGVTAHLAG